MNKEVEELSVQQYESMLQSEDTRARIIDVVCDSDKVDEKIKKLCDEKIDSFDKDLKIDTYVKQAKIRGYWIPIVAVTVVGIANIVVTIAVK